MAIYSALALNAVGSYSRRNRTFFLSAGVFLVWFMGFRYEIGCDHFGYLHRWTILDERASISDLLQTKEAGFALLMRTVKASGLDYTWFNVLVSLILVFCYISFARMYSFGRLVLALLFPVIMVQLGMSGVRQALAGGFLMLSFNAYIRKERLWTAIWIIVGMQFHASVIVFLPIAFLADREVSTIRLAVSLMIIGPIAGLLLGDRFDTYEERYGSGDVTSRGAIIRYALVFLPVPFFAFYQRKVRAFFPDLFPLLKLSALMIFSLFPLVVLSSIALHRLNYYVFPLSILLLICVASVLSKKVSNGHWLAVLAYGGYSFFWFLSSKHAQLCYIPYNNTWFM